MARRPPSRVSLISLVLLGLGFCVWTALVASGAFDGFDRTTAYAGLVPDSPAAQIFSAVSLVFWPGVVYAVLVGVAISAFDRRLRNIGIACLLSIVIGWGGAVVLKHLIGRERPETPLTTITHSGFAYPSGHVTAITVAVIMSSAFAVVTRQSRLRQVLTRLIGVLLIALVAVDRWVMNAHWISDIVGALLWGGLVAAVSLVGADVRVLPANPLELLRPATPPVESGRLCAVIFNPTKVLDVASFRRHVDWELDRRGWDRIWLETTRHDPGYGMADEAKARGVDLVLGAGGDGTIRAICESLSGSGIPFGIVPAGTGNLLARNLGVPLDEGDALDVAFEGRRAEIDLVELAVTDEHDELQTHTFAVIAGIGVDATIMERTNTDLKKAVGSAAYFVSAARNARHPPLPVTIHVDDRPPFHRRASVILLGNVGILQGGIQIIPGARADDGLLDLLVASPRTASDWARMVGNVFTRREHDDARVDRIKAHRVRIVPERADAYQLDGDTVGRCSALTAEVRPGALTLMLPR